MSGRWSATQCACALSGSAWTTQLMLDRGSEPRLGAGVSEMAAGRWAGGGGGCSSVFKRVQASYTQRTSEQAAEVVRKRRRAEVRRWCLGGRECARCPSVSQRDLIPEYNPSEYKPIPAADYPFARPPARLASPAARLRLLVFARDPAAVDSSHTLNTGRPSLSPAAVPPSSALFLGRTSASSPVSRVFFLKPPLARSISTTPSSLEGCRRRRWGSEGGGLLGSSGAA